MYDSDRKIDVEWGPDKEGSLLFDVKLSLDVEDRQGLLAKILSAVSEESSNVKNVEAQTDDSPDARISMILSVTDRKQMERVMAKIRKIKGVREVARILR
jgi:GTP pyrophosphokinase